MIIEISLSYSFGGDRGFPSDVENQVGLVAGFLHLRIPHYQHRCPRIFLHAIYPYIYPIFGIAREPNPVLHSRSRK